MCGRPENIRLFRMVHWQNIAHILKHGLCSREHQNADPNYINIGMQSLIRDRHEHPIPLTNAGNLGEYVPFYFAGHSPMLYLIMNGYSGVTQRPQNDIVFIVVEYQTLIDADLEYVFTDKNAKIAVANFYNHEDDFDQLNWSVIKARNWSNDNQNLDKRDLKQAEFMVRHHIPRDCIYALVVKTAERKEYFDELISNFGLSIQVFVDNNLKLYY